MTSPPPADRRRLRLALTRRQMAFAWWYALRRFRAYVERKDRST